MTNRIHIMPEILSSKIAAGEVVERPASVVKELMENAIDSGATTINVAVAEGGRRLMRVADNGSGIDSEDLPLVVVRHATSKISSDEDLAAIQTMGFRGEAISSIASVARVTIKSRTAESEEGAKLYIEGGSKPVISPVGMPVGTTVEVEDLFFNTPARAKFLRTAGTEFGRITDIFKKIAMAHPDKRFKLLHGSSTVIDTAPGSLGDRITEIYGGAIFKELTEIMPIEMPDGLRVTGYSSLPTLSYPTGKGLLLYVNNRPVRDPGLTRAVINGYGSLLDRGRYPFAVISIDISPEDVDVNVHPAKNEVRFANHGYIFETVRTAINRTLGTGQSRQGQKIGEPNYDGYGSPPPQRDNGSPDGGYYNNGGYNQGSYSGGSSYSQHPYSSSMPGRDAMTSEHEEISFVRPDEKTLNPEFLELDVVGQLWGEFLICQSWRSGGEYFLIDQHGAAERVRFEELKKDFYKESVESQLLLIPERIETSPEEEEALRGALPMLAKLGFEIEPFGPSTRKGGETFMIKATPEILSGRGAGTLIMELTEELSHSGTSTKAEAGIEAVLMRIACHSVMRGQKGLTREEAKALLTEMSRIDFVAHCPHGRPVVKRYSRREVEAIFKRS